MYILCIRPDALHGIAMYMYILQPDLLYCIPCISGRIYYIGELYTLVNLTGCILLYIMYFGPDELHSIPMYMYILRPGLLYSILQSILLLRPDVFYSIS